MKRVMQLAVLLRIFIGKGDWFDGRSLLRGG
jgi:hypothetical protein